MKEEQLAYFTEMITAVEASIKDGTYLDYIELKSFASWILAHDILGTADGSGSNILLTKYDNTDDSKVMMANLWDFDSILQMANDWSAVHTMFYFKYLFDNNPNDTFKRAYRKRWEEVLPTIFDDLNSFIDEFAQSEEAAALDQSAQLDNLLWKWEMENLMIASLKNHFKNKLTSRKNWLAGAISNFPSGIIKGDVNGDYKIDYNDVEEMANAITGNPSVNYIKEAANMNIDDVVNAIDIVPLVKKISKTVSSLQ